MCDPPQDSFIDTLVDSALPTRKKNVIYFNENYWATCVLERIFFSPLRDFLVFFCTVSRVLIFIKEACRCKFDLSVLDSWLFNYFLRFKRFSSESRTRWKTRRLVFFFFFFTIRVINLEVNIIKTFYNINIKVEMVN